MEKKVNVKPMKVYLMCDECGMEMERPDEFVSTLVYPPRYTYRCPKCGKTETSTQGYPYIDFVEEKEFDILEHIDELDNTLIDLNKEDK